ncbi:hypothetical protein KA005_81130, partial [bacterium]|nr:hypothetical protein [bacterium]
MILKYYKPQKLKRKRIIIRLIGYEAVGMGHIYRSRTLAHTIKDHEIIFICDAKSQLAVQKIVGHDYIEAVPEEKIVERIISLKPDLVINDILDTSDEYIRTLKQHQIKVVNFEDMGAGAALA